MSDKNAWVILVSTLSLWSLKLQGQDTTVAARDTAPPPSLTARDPLTGRIRVSGDLLRVLPIDDVRQVLHLAPGVIVRGAALAPDGATTATVRGRAAGATSAYIDGAPVRLETLGVQGITLAPFMVAELGIETSVADAALWDARGGVVSYVTPTGGANLRGRLRAETDEAFGDGSTVGYTRLEGMLGGPVPGVGNLRFFAAAQLHGQRSQYWGMGAADQPTYVLGGPDTTVQVSDGSGGTLGVEVPRFAQWSDACAECRGLERPMDWTTNVRLLGKLHYQVGERSHISITGLATGRQDRFFPGSEIGAPSLYRGAHTWSRLLILDLRHPLHRAAHGDVTLHANLSYATDRAISGPLTPDSERDSREPGLGIELGTLRFTGLDLLPFPVTERIVRNFRTNSGLRVPYLDRFDLRNAQPYRLNPFGLASGWPTSGLDAELTLLSERRIIGRASVEWAPLPHHRLSVGVDGAATSASFYQANLIDQSLAEAFVVEPRRYGVFAIDRFSTGALTLDLGMRIDRLDPGSELATVPGFIFGHPAWNASAATDDTAYANSVARVMTPVRARSVFSPRIRAGYALGRTNVRVAWGQYLDPPIYRVLFAGANSDIITSGVFQSFGRDVEPAETSVLELGLQHDFGRRAGANLTLYRAAPVFAYGVRVLVYSDPRSSSDTVLVNSLTRSDNGEVLGLDVRVDWRLGEQQGFSVGYSLASVRPDDMRALPGGTIESPAVNTHGLSAVVTAAFPHGWRKGTAIGTLAAGVSGAAVFRAVSGVPYTRLVNNGVGQVVPDGPLSGTVLELPNSSRLPWTRHLDLRIARKARVGDADWTVYFDVRNALGFKNTDGLFAETGDVRNDLHRSLVLAPEYSRLQSEAQANGALATDNTVNLRACGTWSSPVNCVALNRVERRFGDGDGLYTQAEQERALNAFYDSFFGPWRFHGPGRTARIGLELEF